MVQDVTHVGSWVTTWNGSFPAFCPRNAHQLLALPSPATLAVMEKYTRNARFCLICNYVSKIIPALQSRCTRFRFQPLPGEFVKGRLEYICQQERCVHWAWEHGQMQCRPADRVKTLLVVV